MNTIKNAILSLFIALVLVGTVYAEESPLKGIKLGFGFDRGFGIVGSMGKFKGFIGNDGVSVDYIFKRDALKVDAQAPVHWYVAAGGFGDWDGDFGVRLPVGIVYGETTSNKTPASVLSGLCATIN